MINLKNKKHLKIIAGISFSLVVLGAIFNVNTLLMAAVIGFFAGSMIRLFIHNKENF
ncbi:hypothetical protein [Chryseobacterium sp. RLHN22]|uniref:hypothetical protein n=1 Tax=Chryseobacterium sp. RLHN22 TaxID=3437885 RepID=UPI003D9B9CC7